MHEPTDEQKKYFTAKLLELKTQYEGLIHDVNEQTNPKFAFTCAVFHLLTILRNFGSHKEQVLALLIEFSEADLNKILNELNKTNKTIDPGYA